ncbi:MAG TPA: AAA family ATPase [Anaerolineales bacterium]
MLNIQLFGPPTVTADNLPIIIKRRTTRALLYYIAASPKPVSRDSLADIFWPEWPFDKARQALTDHLSKLGADLGNKSLLQVSADFISLNKDNVNVDWLEFYDLMTQVNKTPAAFTPNQSLSAGLYQKMSSMVLLWNSHEFIENDEVALNSDLDEWLSNVRTEYSTFLKRVLPRLAQHEALTGNHNLAIHWLGLARTFDEFDDEVNEALVNAYINAHRQSEGLAIFQEIKEIYGEGDTHNTPQFLRALEERLYSSHSSANSSVILDPSILPGLSVPFVGQRNALTELKISSQRRGGIIVLGDGGSGKTRLVYEFCRQQGPGKRLLVASCQPLESSMPFAAWISMLRASISNDEWQKLDATWAAPLTLILPELLNLRQDLRSLPAGRSETPRTVLLEAIHQLLRMLTRKQELILFMDDAHWADESSLAMVSYLLQKSFFDSGRSLLILAARTEQNSPLLNSFLVSSHPEPLHRVYTQLFNVDELAELCYFVFSRNVPMKFLERLYNDTGGNAFFAARILHELLEENPGQDFEKVDALPMPAAISDAIQRKFQALSQPAQEVVSTAAVMGSQFEIQQLEEALGLSSDQYMLALEELEQARIIQPVRKADTVFGFVHEKLREGLLLQLNQNRKRLLHRKVALSLEKNAGIYRSGQASLLAYHFQEAGMYNKAFDAWVLAAEYAWKLMATHDAINACQMAEQLLQHSVGFGDAQIYGMYRMWGQIAYENDDFEVVKNVNQALYDLGVERQNPLMIGSALTGLSDAEMAQNQYEKALEFAEKALEYIQRTDSLYEQSRALNRRGVTIYMLGRLRESQASFRKALELTQDSEENSLVHERSFSYNRLAVTETLLGYPLQALEFAQQSISAATEAHLIYEQISAYNVMGLANYLLTNYSQGRETAMLGIELAKRVDSWRLLGYLCAYAGICELELGLIDDSWDHAQKAIEIGQRRGHGEIIGLGLRIQGDLYRHLGALAKARECYQQGVNAAGKQFVALENIIRLGYTQVLIGDATGRQQLLEAVNSAVKAELGAIAVPGVTFELSMYLLVGEKGLFETRVAWLKEQLKERTGQDLGRFYIDRILAENAFREKDYQQAYELAGKALDWYHQNQNAWYELKMAWMMECSARNLGIQNGALRPRIDKLLQVLEGSLRDAPLQDEWQVFRQNYSPQPA